LGVGASDASNAYFAGGGGGSHTNGSQLAAPGGLGGGGYGGGNGAPNSGNNGIGFDATPRTGGGGGGGDTGKVGGDGSNGIVVLRAQTLQQLNITTQPSATLDSGDTFPASGQPMLELLDLNGNVATTDSTTQVTASISGNGRLTGTVTEQADEGVVTFTNLGIRNWQAENLTITFTANTPQPLTATSDPIAVSVPACSRDAQTSDDWYTYWVFTEYGGCEWTAPSGITSLDHLVLAGGGGSGGGGGGNTGLNGGTAINSSYGKNGGAGFANAGTYGHPTGGGGGAGADGGPGTFVTNSSGSSGAGGAGKSSSMSGTATTYAGGGGGGCHGNGTYPCSSGAGGIGGGGAGDGWISDDRIVNGGDGTANTGGVVAVLVLHTYWMVLLLKAVTEVLELSSFATFQTQQPQPSPHQHPSRLPRTLQPPLMLQLLLLMKMPI